MYKYKFSEKNFGIPPCFTNLVHAPDSELKEIDYRNFNWAAIRPLSFEIIEVASLAIVTIDSFTLFISSTKFSEG
jgi:hypothetical protein